MSVILTRFTTLFYHTRFLSSSLTYCIKIKSLCFITFPNIDKGVQNIMCRRVTLMKFEVFGKVIKHCFTSISSIKAKLLSYQFRDVLQCLPLLFIEFAFLGGNLFQFLLSLMEARHTLFAFQIRLNFAKTVH